MGLLSSILGSESYPRLPDDNYATGRVDKVTAELRQLVSETRDRIEVVPAEQSAYVFIGKPPKKFGLAWVSGGKVTNLGKLAQQKNLSPITVEKISDELSAAYKRSENEQRYSYELDGRELVVTPSSDLENEVDRIIQALLT